MPAVPGHIRDGMLCRHEELRAVHSSRKQAVQFSRRVYCFGRQSTKRWRVWEPHSPYTACARSQPGSVSEVAATFCPSSSSSSSSSGSCCSSSAGKQQQHQRPLTVAIGNSARNLPPGGNCASRRHQRRHSAIKQFTWSLFARASSGSRSCASHGVSLCVGAPSA